MAALLQPLSVLYLAYVSDAMYLLGRPVLHGCKIGATVCNAGDRMTCDPICNTAVPAIALAACSRPSTCLR